MIEADRGREGRGRKRVEAVLKQRVWVETLPSEAKGLK